MTVRTAELIVAIVLALVSAGIMWSSTDGLSIGWVKGKGPGSGAWPFWLSALMLLSCISIIINWFRGTSPESRSNEIFISEDALVIVGVTVLALTALLFATHFIGIYFSMMLFLIFYLRIMGRHSWTLTFILALATPISLFFFFEGALIIPLPKGYAEPLFEPLYDLIY